MKFDIDKLEKIIFYYKKDIKNISLDEVYKLKAIKCFQDNWDINAEDFYEMLSSALSKSKRLLASRNFFPKNMILYFASKEPETVREMFVNLFNETISLSRRIDSFRDASDILLKQYADEKMSTHYQNLNAISTYLFFRFPEKYCVYKEGKFKNFADKIGYDSSQKRGSFEILQAYYDMCDDVFGVVKNDEELLKIAIDRFRNMNFADNGLHLLTEEIIYIGSKINFDSILDITQDDKKQEKCDEYTKEDFLREVYIDEQKYDLLVGILNRKKNIILQGAPGVGKTFLSRRLAYSILGAKDDHKVKFVQFHQNYSYEDFIIGYKPCENGFELKYGVFYNFCKKAEKNPENKYFFIIDEINRGNISKIFGELMMLIENSYRGMEIELAYGGEMFSVPQNIYIIGIMNTADRSIAMIDYALRRRFSFFDVKPAFESDRFLSYIDSLNNKKISKLVDTVKLLNEDITEDFSLGEGFCIGHSYFLSGDFTDRYIYEIVEFDIIPLLREYWFDDYDKLEKWEKALRDIVE
ncbi:AAA family ATPase [Intestinibacter sp.]|uniref:AAA family ATPase n=1 Tax=Intestinibacter sp. TaxID=1965304 RepID=UPI002A75CFA0|nr:AAA family ATPase [Intestinibacter sp.]MDY2735332.1 AAA family ATPase [Intestinibacter sp.]